MDQSKHSEEQILKLGRKIIIELELVYTVNTLARWIGHYLSDLMYSIDSSQSEIERAKLKKECCSLILEIWDKRGGVPIQRPLEKLKPIIDAIGLLNKREHPFILHNFMSNNRKPKLNNPSWGDFLNVVKDNSERIYRKSLEAMISDQILEKDNEWVSKYGTMLSDSEKEIIKYLNSINELTISFRNDSNEDFSEEENIVKTFNELEEQIDEQKRWLLNLKKEVLKNYK